MVDQILVAVCIKIYNVLRTGSAGLTEIVRSNQLATITCIPC